MRFGFSILLSIFSFLMANHSEAKDLSRYPRRSYRNAGEQLCILEGVYRSVMPKALIVNVDPTFSQSQKILLRKSATVFFDRALNDDIIDCAYAHSFRGLPSSAADFKRQIYEVFSLRVLSKLHYAGSIYIAKYWDFHSVGTAYLNLYYDREYPLPGYRDRHYMHVAINDNYLDQDRYPYGSEEDYWAGVLAHEVLHNLNYVHGQGGSYHDDYAGYFVNEYGNCIHGNGLSRDIPVEYADRVIFKM